MAKLIYHQKTDWRAVAQRERKLAAVAASAVIPGGALVALGYVTGEIGMFIWPAVGGWLIAMSLFCSIFLLRGAREMDGWADESENWR